ncbi:nucleotidyltransferase family protein [Bacillus sp. DTU_2020_1000418_1_SI_GHA_SEK_038]|uniref:nucleotidyltransferase family protein n=1 Tax=Bacillus sp. DTU_2020_1000418_1_SI_GHA_SEK_038 TaxID=3077585 RepID=UPI0028F16FF8|nr:nucleotidyltransferase family protein [Bacillus sp. DTU_2020_1000418_1_SI_GHA_SEK_038]WNS76147.1 nucleotidyltransferase family protein [Bacillus sp. DTU_2020_1000418_1_SI_GHA_SEK_038]
MTIKSEEDIVRIISEDTWMMVLLKTVKTLNLPDWWICAGFVRSKIWDVLHDFSERTPIPDIDVIYFDSTNLDELEEKSLEEKLNHLMPGIPWSVKNQARMHVINNLLPYTSSIDGISKFPETVTALGVKLDGNDNVILAAPWGINDVVNLEVKPTPYFAETKERMEIYENRVAKKAWDSIWHKVNIFRY